MRHKKLIIGTGICLLGIALSAAWFVPCKLEATYAGKTPYQYDVISAKSFHASTVSLLGRKNPVTDVSISPKELSKSPQNITVTYGDMSQKTAAVVAAETYKTELDNSVSNVTTDSIFVSVQQKYTESGEYFLTHIIVNDPSSQVKGGLSNDSWGGYREYPTTYAGRTGAAVTTNGSYFSYDSGQPVCAGCFIKGGKILKDGVTNGKEICLDNTGKFYTPSAGISASTLLASGVKDIWGTADPLLIQDGQKVDLANQQKINNTYYNRTAIGMVQPGEYYMITAGTAQYKNGLSFAELQSIFANLGCTYARSMDGGGSSSLVVNGKLLNTPAQYDERPVVDFLSFLP